MINVAEIPHGKVTYRGAEYPALARSDESDLEYIEYEIQFDMLNRVEGGLLETLAELLYGDAGLWYRIFRANPLRHPSEWQVGDVILIPRSRTRKTNFRPVRK